MVGKGCVIGGVMVVAVITDGVTSSGQKARVVRPAAIRTPTKSASSHSFPAGPAGLTVQHPRPSTPQPHLPLILFSLPYTMGKMSKKPRAAPAPVSAAESSTPPLGKFLASTGTSKARQSLL